MRRAAARVSISQRFVSREIPAAARTAFDDTGDASGTSTPTRVTRNHGDCASHAPPQPMRPTSTIRKIQNGLTRAASDVLRRRGAVRARGRALPAVRLHAVSRARGRSSTYVSSASATPSCATSATT